MAASVPFGASHRRRELFRRRTFRSQADARQEVFQYIEGWYSPHRRHSGIDYLSPVAYERKHTTLTSDPKPSTVH